MMSVFGWLVTRRTHMTSPAAPAAPPAPSNEEKLLMEIRDALKK